ncbi:MAG: aldehyde dehydrogenase family protein [Chitinophagaceae bacterium]|nr:MAG: aldehyde dehydrogenase family protein [Chitinophagaceae bacterium]
MRIINPATEELITELPDDNAATLEILYTRLRKAQPSWAAKALRERIEVIERFAVLLKDNIKQLAGVLTSEVGKPLQQSRNEINGAITRINWLTGSAGKWLSPELVSETATMEERISYDPLGVICNISAWNYPYLVGVNVFVPALLAGNAVCYKPSEFATLTGLEIEKLLHEAGVDSHVFLLAKGAADTGRLLLDMPFDGYYFTGSYRTGKYIFEKVAPRMIPVQCELGGKDPLYVADDIEDVPAVAAATADGAFYNNGQSCCAVERIYVHEKIYDRYLDEFVKEVKSWKTGDPLEAGVYIGPLSRAAQSGFLAGQVSDAVAKGARLLTGGEKPAGRGYYFQPTVLADASHDMDLMKEESFGPVIGIMKVKDDAEAIVLMQDTEYGLTASVYSSSRDRAESILGQVDSGSGYWNCCDRVSAALPWSGRGHSGFGSTLSYTGLRAFTKPKAWHLRKG